MSLSAKCFPVDTQPANRIWLPTQPRHCNTREKNTTKSSAPEDGHKVARNMLSAKCFPMDTQPANRIWLPTQPRHYTTREKNTTKSSAPEDGHKEARNMLSNL